MTNGLYKKPEFEEGVWYFDRWAVKYSDSRDYFKIINGVDHSVSIYPSGIIEINKYELFNQGLCDWQPATIPQMKKLTKALNDMI